MSAEHYKRFDNAVEIQWCPGCPNNLILRAVKEALAQAGLSPHEVCLVSGIGQAAKLPHYLNVNFFNGLHGRALPVALGIAAANPKLKLLVTTGEGDCYGEGGNHFIHTIRRNPNLTLIVHDNSFYALTKGQASPTTPIGEVRGLHPQGVSEPPLNPLGIAILHGCGFVARGFALEREHLSALIGKALAHPGFSVIDVIQPCITWDNHPMEWFRERIYKLGSDHDPRDPTAALRLTTETDRAAIGLFYHAEQAETFGARFRSKFGEIPLAEMPLPGEEVLTKALSAFKVS